MSTIIVGPLTNEKLLIFVNKDLLKEFCILTDTNEYEIIVNEELEFLIYDFQGENSLMQHQKPTKYFFFNPDDKDWVLNFLNLA